MDELRTDRPILDSIGPYHLVRHLRANGPVQVYLAHEEGKGRPSRDVVLKLVSKLGDEDAKKIEELRREARVFSKLSHPAIVRTFDCFEHDNSLVFALEHIDGVSLAELMATKVPQGARPLSDDEAFHVAVSMLDGLAYAHRMCDQQGRSTPVVHKGLSPSKVLVGGDGTVKLGGFGLAKPVGVTVDRKRKLQWESVYLAPEQILAQQSSPKVDVYAAGLILWELLSGRASAIVAPRDPFARESAMRALAERTLESLATLRPDLPRALTRAVDAALVPSHEKRTIGCAELAQEFKKHARAGRGREELRAHVQSMLVGAELETLRPAPVEQVAKDAPLQPSRKQPPPLRRPADAVSRPPQLPAPAREHQPVRAAPIVMIDAPPPAAVPPSSAEPPNVAPSVAYDAKQTDRQFGTPAAQFAKTFAITPEPAMPSTPSATDSVTGSTMEVPASTQRRAEIDRPVLPEIESPADEHAITPDDLPTLPLSSILGRLRAPTRWPRSAWIATWAGLAVALALLIGALAIGRPRSALKSAAVNAATVPPAAAVNAATVPPAAAETAMTAPPAAVLAPPPVSPIAPSEPARAAPTVEKPAAKMGATAHAGSAPAKPSAKPTPKAPAVAPRAADSSMGLKKRHLGHLMVHSLASYAKVYMMFTKYGKVEEKLTVPCGRRFMAIGLPPRTPHSGPSGWHRARW